MSKDWTNEELEQVSKTMIENGHMGFEELCESLWNGVFVIENSEPENTTGKKGEQS